MKSNKKEFIRDHERQITLAFYYLWNRQRRKLDQKKIELIKHHGYIPKEIEKEWEEDYNKLTKKFLFPLYLLYLHQGEKDIHRLGSKDYVLQDYLKEEWADRLAKERAKYFKDAQKEATESILRNETLQVDPLLDEMIKYSVGLDTKSLKALTNHYEHMKNGGSNENRRKAAYYKNYHNKLKERAKTVGTTETAQSYSAMNRKAMDDARYKYGWELTKTWYTSADERVCPFCGDLMGVKIPFDDLFLGYLVGPEESHPRCRCDLIIERVL